MTSVTEGLYAFGAITAVSTPSGAAVSASSVGVVAAGGDLVSQYAIGDPIRINGVWRTVGGYVTDLFTLLVDPAQLVVSEAWDETVTATPYKIVPTSIQDDLDGTAPKGLYGAYSKAVPLGTGGVRGAGWKTVEWRWGFISQAQREALRAYCPGASAEVVIRTRVYDDSDPYLWFQGQMLWPEPKDEDRQSTRRLNFILRFQGLTQLSVKL